jgi:hypothetical protein
MFTKIVIIKNILYFFHVKIGKETFVMANFFKPIMLAKSHVDVERLMFSWILYERDVINLVYKRRDLLFFVSFLS